MTVATGMLPGPFYDLSKKNKIKELNTNSKEFFLSLSQVKLFKEIQKVKFTRQLNWLTFSSTLQVHLH